MMNRFQTQNLLMDEWAWKQIGSDKFIYYKPESIMKKIPLDDLKARGLKVKKSVSFAKVAQIKNLKNHKIYLQPISPSQPPNHFPLRARSPRSTLRGKPSLKAIKEQDSVSILLKKPDFLPSTSSILIKNSSLNLTARKSRSKLNMSKGGGGSHSYRLDTISSKLARDIAFEKKFKTRTTPIIRFTTTATTREGILKRKAPLSGYFGGTTAYLDLDLLSNSSIFNNANNNHRGQPSYRSDTFSSRKAKNIQAAAGAGIGIGVAKKSNKAQSYTPARSINKSKIGAEEIEKKRPSITISTRILRPDQAKKLATNNNAKQTQTRDIRGRPSYRSDTVTTKLAKDLLINPRKFKSSVSQSTKPTFNLNPKKKRVILPEYFGGTYPDLPSKSSTFTYLRLGMRVSTDLHIGHIRYLGTVKFEPDVWVGLELDAPIGKHDGSFRGTRYYTVQKDYGLLVRVSQINYNGVNGCWIVPPDLQPFVEKFPEDSFAIYMLKCLVKSFTSFRNTNSTKTGNDGGGGGGANSPNTIRNLSNLQIIKSSTSEMKSKSKI